MVEDNGPSQSKGSLSVRLLAGRPRSQLGTRRVLVLVLTAREVESIESGGTWQL